jgi:hypothetical protein
MLCCEDATSTPSRCSWRAVSCPQSEELTRRDLPQGCRLSAAALSGVPPTETRCGSNRSWSGLAWNRHCVRADGPKFAPFRPQMENKESCPFDFSAARVVAGGGSFHRSIRRELIAPTLQPFVKYGETIAIPPQYFQTVSTLVAEHEQMSGIRIFANDVLDQREQPVKPLTPGPSECQRPSRRAIDSSAAAASSLPSLR